MDKSVLNEIDRLEGIAQAYARRRPIVPMASVFEDCNEARGLVGRLDNIDHDIATDLVRLAELQYDVDDTRTSLDDSNADRIVAQDDLGKLMASLSARLER